MVPPPSHAMPCHVLSVITPPLVDGMWLMMRRRVVSDSTGVEGVTDSTGVEGVTDSTGVEGVSDIQGWRE